MVKPLIGTVGIGLIEGVDSIPSVNGTTDIIKIVVQVVLAIASLYKMFKKPKEVISNQNVQPIS
ncbi:hypothetical protein [Flavobacterium algoritolerans]|uniref:Uncharacterized protein n=1 Tax=Flavobacterium algoritolerans TaxID=3041254 RepID=A0ABT6VC70_9FLAO|nr:hypothetical protein [Flavobacterium algoritolerans]MDI5895829.1 hypothetical protein [Flavobacterium algoritolerans]